MPIDQINPISAVPPPQLGSVVDSGQNQLISKQMQMAAPLVAGGVGLVGLVTLMNQMRQRMAAPKNESTLAKLRKTVTGPIKQAGLISDGIEQFKGLGGLFGMNSNSSMVGDFIKKYITSPYAYALPAAAATGLGAVGLHNAIKKNYPVKPPASAALDNEIEKFHNILQLEAEMSKKPNVGIENTMNKVSSANLSDKDKEDVMLVYKFLKHIEKQANSILTPATAIGGTAALLSGAGFYNMFQAKDKAKLDAVREAINRYRLLQPPKLQAVLTDKKHADPTADLSNIDTNIVPIVAPGK